jgi:hypothetical protein
MQGQADLLEVIQAAHARRSGPHLLDGGQQQADQDRDDGDDHQQLDQREATSSSSLPPVSDPGPAQSVHLCLAFGPGCVVLSAVHVHSIVTTSPPSRLHRAR